jgi:hypothetical protein
MFTYVATIGIDTGLCRCEGCGALVTTGDKGLHMDFHARIAELENANASA